MSTSNHSTTVHLSLLGLLGMTLLVLKLSGTQPVAQWAWYIVLLPFYFPVLVWLTVIAIVGVVALAAVVLAGVVKFTSYLMDRYFARRLKRARKTRTRQ